jgi:hypothetical protein
VLVHQLCLRFRLGPVLAALSALWCVLALLSVNGTVEFAFLLGLMACLCVASNERAGWVWFFAFMGLAFLVRPEYLVGVASALALLFWRRDRALRWGQIAGAVVLAGCLFLAWESGAAGRGRSWFAFGQQFAVNYAAAHELAGDPLVEWQSVAAQAFPTSGSIAEAVRENPRAAVWHLGYNVFVRVPRAVAGVLVPVPSFVAWRFPWREMLAAAVVVAALLATFAGVRSSHLRSPHLAPLLALATIPSVSLVFRPQARHFLPLLPLAVVLVGTALRPGAEERHPRLGGGLRAVFIGVLLLGLASPWVHWARMPPLPGVSLDGWIRSLRHDARRGRLRLLASWYADRACALVGPDCRAVSPADFIDGHEVDVVLIGPDWAARPDVQGDPRVRAFVSRPEDFGCDAGTSTPEGFRLVRCRPPLKLAPPG